MRSRPVLIFAVSLLLLVIAGAAAVKLPAAVPPGQPITMLDAVFTAASALCGNGLAVRDASRFMPFGQAILAVLMQLGGLAVLLTGAACWARWTGRSVRAVRLVFIVLLVELLAAAALLPMWNGSGFDGQKITFLERLGCSAFTAIGAFCNAGFTVSPDGLTPYRHALLAHGVILPLVVLGGLGFPVLEDVWRRLRRRDGQSLNPQVKLALAAAAALYLAGTLALTLGQLKPHANAIFKQGQTSNQRELPPLDARLVGATFADASFLAVSSRSAGFSAMPVDEVSPAGVVALMALMFVGGTPGSAAGGIGTITFAVLLLAALRRDSADHFPVPGALLRPAVTVFASMALLITAAAFLLSLSEPYPLSKLLFESISAATGSGLSLGVTPDLTAFGKTVAVATMVVGRVLPLALFVSVRKED